MQKRYFRMPKKTNLTYFLKNWVNLVKSLWICLHLIRKSHNYIKKLSNMNRNIKKYNDDGYVIANFFNKEGII